MIYWIIGAAILLLVVFCALCVASRIDDSRIDDREGM